jgi:hypothetical protein
MLSMLCYEDNHIIHEHRNFKIGLLHLLSFHQGIILRRNSTDSKKVFYIQKRIIRIMAATKRRASCRELFKKFNIFH